MSTRPAAVAGTWYPGSAGALTREVDAIWRRCPASPARQVHGGDRAACRADVLRAGRRARLQGRRPPAPTTSSSSSVRRTSWRSMAWRSIRTARSRRRSADADRSTRAPGARADGLAGRSSRCRRRIGANTRSRCSCRSSAALLPDVPIVPLLMGFQTRETIDGARRGAGRRVARTTRTARGEHRSVALLRRHDRAPRSTGGCRSASRAFDAEGLLELFEQLSRARARPLRRVRRRAGDRGDDGGAGARRRPTARPQVRALGRDLRRLRRRGRLSRRGIRRRFGRCVS